MRLSTLRTSAMLSLLGLSSAQSSSTSSWGEPFTVAMSSTDSLLSSSQQALTNIVGTNTPTTTTGTGLAPAVPVTDEFSTTIPTEMSTMSTVSSGSAMTSVVTVTSSVSGSAASASRSASASASASGSGAATQSSAAAAAVGVQGQQKMMGVVGALAGAAGVLFV